jgi:nucleoid DNA-binding protein
MIFKKGKSMNKADLVSKVSEIVGTNKEAREVVECVFGNMTAALKGGEEVKLSGFGTFKVKERKARTGRNPQTGDVIKIEKKKTARFTPAKALKDAIS